MKALSVIVLAGLRLPSRLVYPEIWHKKENTVRLIAIFALAALAGPALADQKFNPYSGDHQYVPRPNGNEPKLEYNPYEGKHEYVPDTSPRSRDQGDSLYQDPYDEW